MPIRFGLYEGEQLRSGVIRVLENARINDHSVSVFWIAETLKQKDVGSVRRVVEALIKQGKAIGGEPVVRGGRSMKTYCLAQSVQNNGVHKTKIAIAWHYMCNAASKNQALTKRQIEVASGMTKNTVHSLFALLISDGVLLVHQETRGLPSSYIMRPSYSKKGCPMIKKTSKGKALSWKK